MESVGIIQQVPIIDIIQGIFRITKPDRDRIHFQCRFPISLEHGISIILYYNNFQIDTNHGVVVTPNLLPVHKIIHNILLRRTDYRLVFIARPVKRLGHKCCHYFVIIKATRMRCLCVARPTIDLNPPFNR